MITYESTDSNDQHAADGMLIPSTLPFSTHAQQLLVMVIYKFGKICQPHLNHRQYFCSYGTLTYFVSQALQVT